MPRIRFPRIGRTQALIGALTLLTATLMLCLDGTRDGDLYLQLASGRFIAGHGLASVDPYAVHHPPRNGHIAAYAGIGAYMLWRSPRAPVELDGWLEHFTPAELRGTYAILDGRVSDPTPYVRRLHIGAVIADRHVAIRILRTHGFKLEFRTPAGAYLVKRVHARARQALLGQHRA